MFVEKLETEKMMKAAMEIAILDKKSKNWNNIR